MSFLYTWSGCSGKLQKCVTWRERWKKEQETEIKKKDCDGKIVQTSLVWTVIGLTIRTAYPLTHSAIWGVLNGPFSVGIRVSFVRLSPSMAAPCFVPGSTLDLHDVLLSFKTVNSHHLLSASYFQHPDHLSLQPEPITSPCMPSLPLSPLHSPSLPVVLRPVSLTLPDSSLKGRNRTPDSVTIIQNNKPCLLPNYTVFFLSSPLVTTPHETIHPCILCMKALIAIVSSQSNVWNIMRNKDIFGRFFNFDLNPQYIFLNLLPTYENKDLQPRHFWWKSSTCSRLQLGRFWGIPWKSSPGSDL